LINWKHYTLFGIFAVIAFTVVITACDNSNEQDGGNPDPVDVMIDGLTLDNYPRVDGSTSTNPLNNIIAARLLGLEYKWTRCNVLGGGIGDVVYDVYIKGLYDESEIWDIHDFYKTKLRCTQTHNAILGLIDNRNDLIIVARKMSADERQYADGAGVSLIETPIALDALDFILNPQNQVNSLTVKQIQDIYLGNITNWSETGGANEAIRPFIRNANSGSQEMMNEIVMNGEGMTGWEMSYSDADGISSMFFVYTELTNNPNGICFTPHYYKDFMVRDVFDGNFDRVKTLSVNGIMPNQNSIENKTYPFVADVYVSIRSDLEHDSMAYKLYEWLQAETGKRVIRESGYVPN
jgi:phosphate transport system substrate-binding protein